MSLLDEHGSYNLIAHLSSRILCACDSCCSWFRNMNSDNLTITMYVCVLSESCQHKINFHCKELYLPISVSPRDFDYAVAGKGHSFRQALITRLQCRICWPHHRRLTEDKTYIYVWPGWWPFSLVPAFLMLLRMWMSLNSVIYRQQPSSTIFTLLLWDRIRVYSLIRIR